ncbi:MAG: hypothetical protein K2O01_00450 [Bacteroidales bacterium]|nr:hypothetical protein [Bacteroidales bacterium]
MRLNRFILIAVFGAGLCFVAQARSVDTLSPEGRYGHYMESLRRLDIQTLALLAQTDCRLSELESECYRYYRLQVRWEIPPDLERMLAVTRQAVDYRRSYIDSLYYLQALQALNAKTPDWERADKSIELSLTHNRFFVRAVLFRWTQLQREAERTGVWTACLAYANAMLPPLGWQPKVRALGDVLYVKLLERIEQLMADGLYQDAVLLYEEMKRYLLPEFPLFYLPHRERNLLYTAYQGIFGSYYAVAEKAFERGLYRQAQRQALSAHDYYLRYETYMSGVDRSILLLEKILADYSQFMRYADDDEKAYYAAMVDTITARTGLSVPPLALDVIYDMASELRLAEAASAKTEADATLPADTLERPSGQPVLASRQEAVSPATVEADALPVRQQRWTLAYAQKQWDYYIEQARLYRARRQFIQAQEAYATGDSIRRFYPVRTPADFKAEMEANDLLCVEQLLNKAQYRLWQNDLAQSDSLHRLALAITEKMEPDRRMSFYSLLDVFEEQRKRLLCQQQQRVWDEKIKEIRRQLGFGDETAAGRLIAEAEEFCRADRVAVSPCLSDTAGLDVLRSQWSRLQVYRGLLDSARMFLDTRDSLSFIRYELAADDYFERQGLAGFMADATTLFSRLAFGQDFPLLVCYLTVCLEDGRESDADFISGYLKTFNYNSPLLDQIRKKSKKNRGGQ